MLYLSALEWQIVTFIPNGIHHPPIEDGRLLPNYVKNKVEFNATGIRKIIRSKETGVQSSGINCNNQNS